MPGITDIPAKHSIPVIRVQRIDTFIVEGEKFVVPYRIVHRHLKSLNETAVQLVQ